MEYITRKFDNTSKGLKQKDSCTRELVAQGYRIVSEQVEKGDIKGEEQCCGALICLPLIFLAGRTPGTIVVTYGRETLYCTSCGSAVVAEGRFCATCRADLSKETVTDADSARVIAGSKQEAARRTAEIKKQLAALDRILIDSLSIDHRVDWNSLREEFAVQPPQAPAAYSEPQKPTVLRLSSAVPALEKMIPGIRKKRTRWEMTAEQNRLSYERVSKQYGNDLTEWRQKREAEKQLQMSQIEAKKRLYLAKDDAALHAYWAKVLGAVQYPKSLPRAYSFGYAPEEQYLVVDFTLPSTASVPQIAEVKYNKDQNALENVPVSELWLREFYIKIALRTIHVLFQSDVAGALRLIAFNGRVRAMDSSIGQATTVFVISIQASKEEFAAINLAQVDPKACFMRLKGVLSVDVIQRTPVSPIQFKT